MNKLQIAEQMRRALQLFASSLSDELALEVASVYDEWKPGANYKAGDFITYKLNAVGDPQLYKAIQNHTSSAEWCPNVTPALYKAIGLDDGGYPIWSKPTGAHDAYNKGDIVNYNGVYYESLTDGNSYSPDEYPQGWRVVTL